MSDRETLLSKPLVALEFEKLTICDDMAVMSLAELARHDKSGLSRTTSKNASEQSSRAASLIVEESMKLEAMLDRTDEKTSMVRSWKFSEFNIVLQTVALSCSLRAYCSEEREQSEPKYPGRHVHIALHKGLVEEQLGTCCPLALSQ